MIVGLGVDIAKIFRMARVLPALAGCLFAQREQARPAGGLSMPGGGPA